VLAYPAGLALSMAATCAQQQPAHNTSSSFESTGHNPILHMRTHRSTGYTHRLSYRAQTQTPQCRAQAHTRARCSLRSAAHTHCTLQNRHVRTQQQAACNFVVWRSTSELRDSVSLPVAVSIRPWHVHPTLTHVHAAALSFLFELDCE
jgi:hypothetical protein